MKPSVTLAEVALASGAKLSLRLHDGHHHLRIGGRELMSTIATHSETQLAELACEPLGTASGKRVLIGGLGLGFTLRRVLELVNADASVQVAELVPEVVAWNREFLQSVNGGLLADARVEVVIADVASVLARSYGRPLDAILLDVDNGPTALLDPANAQIYEPRGLSVVRRALRPGGRAVFWSAAPDPAFLERLTRAGFRAAAVGSKAYAAAKRDTHTLFIADRVG